MAIDLKDEILQDFLVEAGEILEQLNEQLVDLEQSPDDNNLLNSIFRGFHTIKGGGSFLSLTNLVEVCHKSEDVFNLLRNNELSLDANMMDVFLRVLDELNSMFEEIRSGIDPCAADPGLLVQLLEMQNSEVPMAVVTDIEEAAAVAHDEAIQQAAAAEDDDIVGADDEITDDEFEALLDTLQAARETAPVEKEVPDASQSDSSPDEISDDEFEALLDSLHGSGAPKAVKKETPQAQSRGGKTRSCVR